jgi:sugar O-acyltransferase (sialic acid O-acetyltransferase NeuD family)
MTAAARAPLWILGAGGHAKVVIATARAAGHTELRLADDDPARAGTALLGVRVAATLAEILADPDATAVLAIGDNAARHRLGGAARCGFATVIHPTAVVDPSVVLGAGSVVFAGAIVQPDSRLGAHAIVNTGASIDHDAAIGAAVHVAPGARLAGNVTLGDGVFVGIGAVIIPGRTIGAWTRIGAGAAVVRDLPASVTATGVPARIRTA